MALTLLLLIIVVHVTASAIALVLASEESTDIFYTLGTDEDSRYSYCAYGSNKWTPLRITALVLLLANQVFMMKASLWFFSAEKPSNPKTLSPTPWATFLLIICWATFYIAEAWFLVDSVRNADQKRYRGNIFSSELVDCQTPEKGVFHRVRAFQGGAALILLSSIASKMYTVFYVEPKEKVTEDGSDSTGEKLGTDTLV